MNIREELEARNWNISALMPPSAENPGEGKEKRQNVISGLFTRETGIGSPQQIFSENEG